jgi:DNA repair protein RecO (recombination protein O)
MRQRFQQVSCDLTSFAMRHKYDTRGIVLSRAPLGEASALITFLTPDLGLVRARAQGLRQPGAKLAVALTTFAESEVVLIRGKEGWRVAGAVLGEDWFGRLRREAVHARASRICALLLRLVAGEAHDAALFTIVEEYFNALASLPDNEHDAAEVLAAIRALSALGFVAGEIPPGVPATNPALLATVSKNRSAYIARINEGISASGL